MEKSIKQMENISLMQYPQLFDGQLFCWFSVIMHHISREECGLLEAIFLPESTESIFLMLFYIWILAKKCNLLKIMMISLPPKLQKVGGWKSN